VDFLKFISEHLAALKQVWPTFLVTVLVVVFGVGAFFDWLHKGRVEDSKARIENLTSQVEDLRRRVGETSPSGGPLVNASNRDLKAKALALVAQLRSFSAAAETEERKTSEREWNAMKEAMLKVQKPGEKVQNSGEQLRIWERYSDATRERSEKNMSPCTMPPTKQTRSCFGTSC
jgi:hypothetical protein